MFRLWPFGHSVQEENSTKDVVSSTFYGVSLPPGTLPLEGDDQPLVYECKGEALQALKKYKGSRFKTFSRKEEAIVYATQCTENGCSPSRTDETERMSGEKPSPFKGPKSQETVKLRKYIEAGDVESFKKTVWANPRYLISSGDTPVILQEGSRYNALHVAARFKQSALCQLVLETIQDPSFMALLYSDDSEDVRFQRIAFLTDLYLNTPDRGLCETPLHFASKFGCVKAVEVLLSHPACDKSRKNKYGLEAKQIICERCPAVSPEIKRKIEEAFHGCFYVPVFRPECMQASIGKPLSPSGLISSQEVAAIAGPMSPRQAALFYKHWRTPPTDRAKSRIRLGDTDKGLERIGRELARDMQMAWKEYWPVLDAWCDISSPTGLQLLENHLRQQYFDAMVEQRNESLASGDSSGGISQLCLDLEKFHLSDGDSPEKPSFEPFKRRCLFDRPTSQNRELSRIAESMCDTLTRLRWEEAKSARALLEEEALPVMVRAFDRLTEVAHLLSDEVDAAFSNYEKEALFRHLRTLLDTDGSSDEEAAGRQTPWQQLQGILRRLVREDFFTPPSSPDSTDDEEAVTPDEGLEIYVLGCIPSKADLDLLRALDGTRVDPVLYPHVSRWMHLIHCRDTETVESWPSPSCHNGRKPPSKWTTPKSNRSLPCKKSLF